MGSIFSLHQQRPPDAVWSPPLSGWPQCLGRELTPRQLIFPDSPVLSPHHFFQTSVHRSPYWGGLSSAPYLKRHLPYLLTPQDTPSLVLSLLTLTTSRIWGERLGEEPYLSGTGVHSVGPACISGLALSGILPLGLSLPPCGLTSTYLK